MTDLTLSELEELANSGYTEGPWSSWIGDDGAFVIEAAPGILCQRTDWPSRAPESRATGALIAAAADLLSTAIASKKREAELKSDLEESRQRHDAALRALRDERDHTLKEAAEELDLYLANLRCDNEEPYISRADGVAIATDIIRSLKEKSNG